MSKLENVSEASMEPIVIRLREAAGSSKRWRCQDKTDRSYCIEFEEYDWLSAKQWFERQSSKFPDEFKNKEMVLVVVKGPKARLMEEAAEFLELLFGQFQMHSPHMDGSHSYRFRSTGWPMTHLIGPSVELALKNVMAEVERSRLEVASTKS